MYTGSDLTVVLFLGTAIRKLFNKQILIFKGHRVPHLVGIVRVNNPGQPEVANLEQQLVRVDKNIGRLQISVQDVSGVDELQSPQQLVEKQSGVTCRRAEGEDQPPSCSLQCKEKSCWDFNSQVFCLLLF